MAGVLGYSRSREGSARVGALIAGVAVGLWLMASPAVLAYDGAARGSAIVAGVLAASMSWIALSEVTRPLRRINLVIGGWLIMSAFVFRQPLIAAITSAAAGLLLGISGLLPSRIKGRYGGGWSSLHA
jgi:hypothetical protein